MKIVSASVSAQWVMLSVVLCAFLGFIGTSHCQAADDPAVKDLDSAKAAHSQAVTKANITLASEFDAQIRNLTTGGDTDGAKVLQTQKSAFMSAGTSPQSPFMKDGVTRFQQAIRAADEKLSKAYDVAIEAFEKESKTDLVALARLEKADIAGPAKPADSLMGPVPTPSAIADELATAKAKHRVALNDAKTGLVATIDERVNAATDAGDLATVQSLQTARASAAVDATIPAGTVKDAAVLAAKQTYGCVSPK